ncbi:hypothetical protein B566_EDAN003127 [Ephemera danica]|nr:hypothetical protein B566_EDAN003127 [Ephemera danica]
MDTLAKELLLLNTQTSNGDIAQNLLTQLTEAVNSPEDTTLLIGPVMKLLPNHNVQIKKAIHHILPSLCKKHPQVALLAANSVLQDCADLNPIVKCLGVHSLTVIPELAEHAPSVLINLLEDGHPRVRLAAVQGSHSFHGHASLPEHGLVDVLYATVRDPDPQVSTAALLTLDAVLAEEGGVIVTKAMARHLLRRLSSFPAPQLASVLQALAKYKPKEEKELFEELSILDEYLAYSTCAAVTINCICLFLTLIRDEFSDLIPALVERSTPALTQYLTSSESGALYVLNFLSSELATPWLSSTPVQRLVPQKTDSTKVKTKKLGLIPRACTEQSRTEELLILSDLLSSTQAEATLTAMEGFSLEGLPQAEVTCLLERVSESLDLLQPNSLPSILPRLLGLYGELLPSSSYLLEHMKSSAYCCGEDVPETTCRMPANIRKTSL